MKDLVPVIENWLSSGHRLVLARVVKTWGSSPRPAGSGMIINDKLEMAGSVSGGCVEGAVLKEAKKLLGGEESKLLNYGVTDEEAWTVGLSCGGKISVFIQPWLSKEISDKFIQLLESNKSFVLVSSTTNDNNSIVLEDGTVIGNELTSDVVHESNDALENRLSLSTNDSIIIQPFPRRSRLIIIGAAHVSTDLVKLAKEFNFETIVIDPRGVFARNTNFAVAPDQLMERYPSEVLKDMKVDAHTYVAILSHDPKIDDDALQVLLRSRVAYIGALGSRKNHEKRTARLIEKGFSMEEIDQVDAPIGVDINASGAKEIALSIMASIIKKQNENLRK